MRLFVRLLGVGLLIALPVASLEAEAKKEGKRKTIETKGKKAEAAAAIDFAGELGLDLPSLKTLGARIDQARANPDPVGLAAAAKELAIAEELSGKQTKIKAADLSKGAAEMARLRGRPAELRTVAKLLGDDLGKDLMVVADKTAQAEEQRAKEKGSIRPKGITRSLNLVNDTSYYITIYVNYHNVGTIRPYSIGAVYVGDDANATTVLYGVASGTTVTWGPSLVAGPVLDYTLRLY